MIDAMLQAATDLKACCNTNDSTQHYTDKCLLRMLSTFEMQLFTHFYLHPIHMFI